MNDRVFIIVPVFNEADVIEHTIRGLLPLGYSIVAVDDASSDRTSAILQKLPVCYVRHKINMGQGAALQTGIRFALEQGAEYFVTFDADGQHSPADIPGMIHRLQSGDTDILFGSRFIAKDRLEITFLRKSILHVARYVNFLLTGILLSDAHNGLRVFNRKAASRIDIKENRMAHATELLMIVQRHKLKYDEAPVHIHYTPYSVKKGQKSFHSFKVLQDVFLYKFFK